MVNAGSDDTDDDDAEGDHVVRRSPCSEQCSACAALCRSPGHPNPLRRRRSLQLFLCSSFREREREREKERRERREAFLGERGAAPCSAVKLRKKRNTRHKRNIVDLVSFVRFLSGTRAAQAARIDVNPSRRRPSCDGDADALAAPPAIQHRDP